MRRLSDETEASISYLKWYQSPSDIERSVHTIAFKLQTYELEEKFTGENLSRVLRDRQIRSRMEHRIKSIFKSCGIATEEGEDDVIDETEKTDRRIEFRYSITSYGADYPVDGLVRRLSDGDIFIPTFQRKFVWNRYQSSRFVESLLLGLPVPAIFLGKEEDTN